MTMTTTAIETWDAIVIGSGPGGLTTAACLGSSGKRVLVLESHDLAGGNTQVFRRHHGDDWYEFDVGVHYIGECGDGDLFTAVYNSLGIGDRLTFRSMDSEAFDTLIFPDREVKIPAGWDEYRDSVVEQFPNDRAGIERFLDVLKTVANEARGFAGPDRPTYDRWAMRPLSDLLDECELGQEASAVLDHWSGLYAGSPKQTAVAMHAAMVNHYMASGAFYPEGGGQMIPARLMQAIESCGGEVRTLSPVERIVIENGRAVGVVLANGDRLDAPIVVSNADYRRTMRDMVGAEHLNPATLSWAEDARMTLGLVCVYVVVDKDLSGPNTNYFVFPDYRTDELYEELDAGHLPDDEVPFAYIALASRKDPDNPELCPPGHTNFQIMTLAPRGYDYWGVEAGPTDGGRYRRDDVYRERKQDITDRLLNAAEKALGPFRDQIVHLETATPLSHERYTRSTGGTSYGYMHAPDQLGENRPSYRTEIDGLWVVGANTVGGHGIAGATSGGVFCAGDILDRPLIVEMFMGEKLIDPATIPADPEGFDPLEYCRGEKLRERRADTAERQRELRHRAD
ncbi:MAG: NAD(P)/FAD-dependent oxidoreductase [Actinomycetota bacterium]